MDMIAAATFQLPDPAGHSPLRRPGSVRRTSTIDMTWPDGRAAGLHLVGRARDILTPAAGGAPVVLAEDVITARMSLDRTIREITSDPARPAVPELVGAGGGGHLRHALEIKLPEEKAAGTPLYLLLDDLSRASLVSSWAWSRWSDDWKAPPPSADAPPPAARQMEGICTGFRPGSSALRPDGSSIPGGHRCAEVVPLSHPDDPGGWHALADLTGVSMRRARRIDVWVEDGLIRVDSGFQDSASAPTGGRVAVHEYSLQATADLATGEVLSLRARPHILPFPECPDAPNNIGRLIGAPMRDLRLRVLEVLTKTLGCTHLNDALRALAEAPVLAERLVG